MAKISAALSLFSPTLSIIRGSNFSLPLLLLETHYLLAKIHDFHFGKISFQRHTDMYGAKIFFISFSLFILTVCDCQTQTFAKCIIAIPD